MTEHLVALQTRLAHERDRLRVATSDGDRQLRTVWIAQIEKEISDEMRFIGMSEPDGIELSDDELMAELMDDDRKA